jgi:hypothetical protein
MLGSFLLEIKDHRRKQGLRYQQGHILLFSILAILSGATSYRKICQFIVAHYEELNNLFSLNWKRMPAYTTIRDIIQGTDSEELEESFRKHSARLLNRDEKRVFIGYDGKVLRGSFDHFQDQKAIQILSAFASYDNIILAHEEIEAKTNEIPVAQELIQKLGLTDCVFTFDALHCQKNAGGSQSQR